MYTKQQASQLRQAFWTAFGKYMMPVPNADGERINWVNYKSGIKHVFFRMEASANCASVSIQLTNPDDVERQLCYEQFLQMKPFLEEKLREVWQWERSATNENGKPVAIIGIIKNGVNVFEQKSWPDIISFLKPRIMALDEFWSVAKWSFE